MLPPPKFKDSPVEFNQHLLFPTNIFDLLPKQHDCYVYETIFQYIDTSEVESKYHHLGQHAYPPKLIISILIYAYSQETRGTSNKRDIHIFDLNKICSIFRLPLIFSPGEAMTRARRSLIDRASTPYYHCIARCVRRAFLCGKDNFSGKSYEHRRQWVVDRLDALVSVFAVEVCAYAVMSNHCHVVLHINAAVAENWSRDEVFARWTQLFTGPVLVQRYLAGIKLDQGELLRVDEYAEEYRGRLMDISWFMRCLNEHLAREANKEAAIPHAYTTSVTAYKKHHTQGAATAAYVLRYVIFPKNSTIYHEHTKYIRLRTLVIPRGLMKRGELLTKKMAVRGDSGKGNLKVRRCWMKPHC